MDIALGVIAPYVDGVITSSAFVADFAGVLEECAVESLWAVEHVVEAEVYEPLYPYNTEGKMPGRYVPMTDPLETLAYLAGITTTVKLGTAVVVAPLHSPAVLAKRATTLDWLSDHRLLLGLGIGWQKEEYAAVGVPYADRGRRLEECIEAMRALWTSHPATYHGRYVEFDAVHSWPAPRAAIPIVLGGNSEPAIRRCGRLGNGWYPWTISPEDFTAGVRILHDAARDAGRSPDEIEITVVPGSANYERETDVDWVRRYVDAGAQRLVVNSRIARTDQLGDFRDRLLAYREQVLEQL